MSHRPYIKNDDSGNMSDLAIDAETLQGYKPCVNIVTLEDNNSTTAGTWLAKTNKVSALVDGQLFLYKITVAGASTTTLNITGSGGALGAKTVYRTGTTKLNTQYAVGHYILLAYNSLNTCFRLVNDYDANSYAYVRQYQHGQNAAGATNLYPILTRYNLTNKNKTYDNAYARFYTDTYIDVTNGYLYAPKVYSGGSEVAIKTDIPTETTVSNWGFTKNVGTVTKVNNISPDSSGNVEIDIPKTISTQDIRITDLRDGTYILTYSGKIRLYWNGTESDDYVEHLQSWKNTWNPILVVKTTLSQDSGTSWFWQCYNFISIGRNFKGKVTPSGNAYTYWQDCKYFVTYLYPSEGLGSKTKPVYLAPVTTGRYSNADQAYQESSAHVCDEYAGGTKVILNGTNKGSSDASFYAPTSYGSSGQFLKSAGANAAPTWETVTIPTKDSWNYDDVYVKYNASQSLTDAQKTQARSNIGAGTSSLAIGTTASTAAAGNHTHSTTLATDSGTATVTMAPNETYKLSTGGTNVIFKTPSDAYKIVETLRKGSEADSAVGYYKIATINHVNWNFCDFCMLVKNSYAGVAYSTIFNCSCSDSNVDLRDFKLNIISGTDISNKLAYLYTYDSNNNLIKVEVFIHATRFEHPMCYIINARPGQQLVIPTQDEFNKATPDKPDGTTMTGYATPDNRRLLNHELGVTIENTTTDKGWGMFNPTYTGYLLQSVRFNANSPDWGVGNYGAGIIFGGADTKGVISTGYGSPLIKFASGSGSGPVWWIGLTGTSRTTYNLDNLKYAPTTAGTHGYSLKSNGSGAPRWANEAAVQTNGSISAGAKNNASISILITNQSKPLKKGVWRYSGTYGVFLIFATTEITTPGGPKTEYICGYVSSQIPNNTSLTLVEV